MLQRVALSYSLLNSIDIIFIYNIYLFQGKVKSKPCIRRYPCKSDQIKKQEAYHVLETLFQTGGTWLKEYKIPFKTNERTRYEIDE